MKWFPTERNGGWGETHFCGGWEIKLLALGQHLVSPRTDLHLSLIKPLLCQGRVDQQVERLPCTGTPAIFRKERVTREQREQPDAILCQGVGCHHGCVQDVFCKAGLWGSPPPPI